MPVVQRSRRSPSGSRRYPCGIAVLSVLLVQAVALCLAGAAAAEGVSGYFDVAYSSLDTTSTDPSGIENRTENDSVTQRYSLMFSRSLAPYLRFYVSGLFDKTDSTSTVNGVSTDSTITRVQPVADLTLRSPVYTAGIRYRRQEATAQSSNAPATTLVNESYLGVLGMKPPSEDLPSIDMRFERLHLFDRERTSADTVSDLAALTMNYTPVKTFLVQYRPSYRDTTNRMTGLETENLSHVGRVEYGDNFFHNRLSFTTSYNVSYSALKTSASGTGTVDVGVVPFAGLSSIDDTPGDGPLAQNNALIDGNVTASAGINIGLPPVGGDSRERNIGLDFSLAQDVNTLQLWVDRVLPASIAGSFSWTIYTSVDNQTWSLAATVFPAPFGTFENRFEISFPPLHTRYIKVVVQPLAPSVPGAGGYPDIFVTELQAFSRQPAALLNKTVRTTSDVYSFDGRLLLLQRANLYFQTSYFLSQRESAGQQQQRWTLSNALTASHRFGPVFSGSAYAGRDDFSDPLTSGSAYRGNLSIEAVPLKTLRHTLSYSGRFEKTNIERTDTNSLYLYNYAQLYAGVDLTASAGRSLQKKGSGLHTESTDATAGVNLQPHRTVNLNALVTSRRMHSAGGGTVERTDWTRRTDESVSFHPTETLYLVAGTITVADQERTRRLQHYAVNWSPFFGGDLQFAVTYTESLSSENDAKVKTFMPSLTWKFARKTYLSASYANTKGESDDGRTDSQIYSVGVRGYF